LLRLLKLLLLELRSSLLWLLKLLEVIEVVSILVPGNLLELPLSLSLLLLQLKLSPGFLLPLSLGCLPPCLLFLGLSSLLLPLELPPDHCSQCLQVKSDEHLKCMLLSLLRYACELSLCVFLDICRQGSVLLIEQGLLIPGQSLPWGGVLEGLETQLLILQLLGYSQPLPGSKHKLVCVPQVNLSKMSYESLSLLARQPWGLGGGRGRRGGGGGWNCR